jgi:hypothetical protein
LTREEIIASIDGQRQRHSPSIAIRVPDIERLWLLGERAAAGLVSARGKFTASRKVTCDGFGGRKHIIEAPVVMRQLHISYVESSYSAAVVLQ